MFKADTGMDGDSASADWFASLSLSLARALSFSL